MELAVSTDRDVTQRSKGNYQYIKQFGNPVPSTAYSNTLLDVPAHLAFSAPAAVFVLHALMMVDLCNSGAWPLQSTKTGPIDVNFVQPFSEFALLSRIFP